MDIFKETFGYSASNVSSLLEWLMSFALVFFFCFVVVGTYERWQKGDMNVAQVWMDVVLAFAVMIGVITYFSSFS